MGVEKFWVRWMEVGDMINTVKDLLVSLKHQGVDEISCYCLD